MTRQEEEEIRAIARAVAREEIALAAGEHTFPLSGLDKVPKESKKVTRRTT